MHILCPICSDLVNQADNINVTKCGHVFHYLCLSQWIERSKTCPQCRNKVTDRCMFRLYPNLSNDTTGEDATTLQSRLDDALLQLRQQKTSCREYEEKIAAIELELKKNIELLKLTEKKLASRDSAISALKEQLEYVKIQNKETQKLKEENENLKKNIKTLNGLQKVLNATSEEVELMLEDYTDVRTVATFATALKRALCESENKKNESRDRLQAIKQQLATEKSNVAVLQAELLAAEEKLEAHKKQVTTKRKRKPSDVIDKSIKDDSWDSTIKLLKMDEDLNNLIIVPDTCNTSINTMVTKIENAESPYLNLKQSSLALAALQRHPTHPLPDNNLKPSEYALLNSARNVTKKPNTASCQSTSIFHQKEPIKLHLTPESDQGLSLLNISYDGMGGHSKLDTFPVPNTRPGLKSIIPRVSAKHKLKKPNTVKSQNIENMLKNKR